MARLAIDHAAWTSHWRTRSVAEKAVLSLGLLAVAMASRQLLVHLAVLTVVLVSVIGFARVPARLVLRGLAIPTGFVLVGLVGIVISVGRPPPNALWSWQVFAVDPSAPERALEVAGRSVAGMAAVLLLALTTPMSDLLAALRRIGVPDVVVEIASVVYRMFFLLLDSQSSIRESQVARLGYSDRRRTVSSLGALLAAVLVRALSRAQRLEVGLAGRGYSGVLPVTSPERPISVPFVGVSIAVVTILGVAAGLAR